METFADLGKRGAMEFCVRGSLFDLRSAYGNFDSKSGKNWDYNVEIFGWGFFLILGGTVEGVR